MAYQLKEYATRQDLDPSLAVLVRLLNVLPSFEHLSPSIQRFLFTIMAKIGSPKITTTINKESFVINRRHNLVIQTWGTPGLSPERPALLYLHGGGWVIGRASCFDAFFSRLASKLSLKIYALNYRRAPEHPFPAAIDDAVEAWQWLTARCRSDGQLHRQGLMVGGDSAGGNLAAVLSIKTRDENLRLPDAQILIYPVTSALDTWSSFQRYDQGFLLTASMMREFVRHYAQSHSLKDGRLSPLEHSNLTGLPPTLMALVGCDILLDEGLAFATRLRQAGTSVEIAIYPQVMHAFLNFLRFDAASLAADDLIELIDKLMSQLPDQKSTAA
ncbi:MAG: alpha/beta hydrolase [Deltaproteobacteria bacterium]|nr:alpha/beta hydrolase [Deltaproteobacteria bacterium]